MGEIDGPRGLGAIMEILAIDQMIEVHGIRKICCEVLVFNEAVIRMHKKFGFEEEGRFREHVLKGDKYEDVVRLALFTEAWGQARPRIMDIVRRIR